MANVKIRVIDEIHVIKECQHHDWIEHDNNREYGFKNCCQCRECQVGCGELLNAEYLDD